MKIDQFTLRTLSDDEKRAYEYLKKQPDDNGVIYIDIQSLSLELALPFDSLKHILDDLQGKAIINQSTDFKRIDDDFSWITILEKVNYNPKTKSPLEYFQAIKKIPNDVLEDLIYTLNEGA